jgi:hypothetical protein
LSICLSLTKNSGITPKATGVFEAGSRNNWYKHPSGQSLPVTDGRSYYQQRGKPAQVLQKGALMQILPDVDIGTEPRLQAVLPISA